MEAIDNPQLSKEEIEFILHEQEMFIEHKHEILKMAMKQLEEKLDKKIKEEAMFIKLFTILSRKPEIKSMVDEKIAEFKKEARQARIEEFNQDAKMRTAIRIKMILLKNELLQKS